MPQNCMILYGPGELGLIKSHKNMTVFSIFNAVYNIPT